VFSLLQHRALFIYLSSWNVHPRTNTQISIICVLWYFFSFWFLNFLEKQTEPNCVLSFFLCESRFFWRNKIDPNEELRTELHLLYTTSILAYKAEYSGDSRSVSFLDDKKVKILECLFLFFLIFNNNLKFFAFFSVCKFSLSFWVNLFLSVKN
jgi:hypothetical protein